jgi:predicted ATPase
LWNGNSHTMLPSLNSSKLYGREQEIKALQAVIDRSRSTKICELVHVTGLSGVGKGAIVQKVLKHERNCIVSLASFDSNLVSHFSVICSSVSGLLRKVVTKNETWEILRESIRDQFNSEEKAILNRLLPGNEDIFNHKFEQSNSLEAGLSMNEISYANDWKDVVSRAKTILRKLIRSLAQNSTVIICLMDINFADSDAISMIKFLFEDRKLMQTVLIVTYDETKLSENSIISEWVDSTVWTCTKLEILGLNLTSLNEFLADILRLDEAETIPLTKIAHARTNGNIHFVFQLVEFWKNQDWLIFKFSATQFKWTWDLAKLQSTPLTESVAEMVSRRIFGQSPKVLRILKLAACLGGKFDVPTLQSIQDVIPGDVNTDIEHILDDCVTSRLLEHLPDGRFMFFHERIRQNVLSYVPQGDALTKIHLRIGLNLRERIVAQGMGRDDLIFKCVDQLSLGYRLIQKKSVLVEIASLHQRAGDMAVEISAFSAASKYYQDGIHVLEDVAHKWDEHRDLCTSLFVSLMDVYYFTGQFDPCLNLIRELLLHKPNATTTMRVNLVRLTILKASSKLKEFLQASLLFLQELGISFPKEPTSIQAQIELFRTMRRVNRLSDQEILPFRRCESMF